MNTMRPDDTRDQRNFKDTAVTGEFLVLFLPLYATKDSIIMRC